MSTPDATLPKRLKSFANQHEGCCCLAYEDWVLLNDAADALTRALAAPAPVVPEGEPPNRVSKEDAERMLDEIDAALGGGDREYECHRELTPIELVQQVMWRTGRILAALRSPEPTPAEPEEFAGIERYQCPRCRVALDRGEVCVGQGVQSHRPERARLAPPTVQREQEPLASLDVRWLDMGGGDRALSVTLTDVSMEAMAALPEGLHPIALTHS